ncbi:hypothetical protein K461DRAFT_324326 [Myriangium duriaei CBS 260.36]|uniref:2EXR domain-containing protein n=1 Tax=Myriangium duriaei CBS 260.36 TaxID=1168546 RepID=A0A9P4IRU1_9PEZI|nr:hypothetical protein K461DRAFT_324326 [Myriangium duriaei CBS 260.36]
MTPGLHTFTFTCFTRLPTEIRLKIWRFALPGHIGPSFSQYDANSWHRGSIRADGRSTLEYSARDVKKFTIRMANVNQEVRDVTKAWAQHEGLRLSHPLSLHNGVLTFIKSFDRTQDWIYIDNEEGLWRLLKFFEAMGHGPLEAQASIQSSDMVSLAIHDNSLKEWDDLPNLAALIQLLHQLHHPVRRLSIVVGQHPDFANEHKRWEVEPLPLGRCVWDLKEEQFPLASRINRGDWDFSKGWPLGFDYAFGNHQHCRDDLQTIVHNGKHMEFSSFSFPRIEYMCDHLMNYFTQDFVRTFTVEYAVAVGRENDA